jgi:hypothetical protein
MVGCEDFHPHLHFQRPVASPADGAARHLPAPSPAPPGPAIFVPHKVVTRGHTRIHRSTRRDPSQFEVTVGITHAQVDLVENALRQQRRRKSLVLILPRLPLLQPGHSVAPVLLPKPSRELVICSLISTRSKMDCLISKMTCLMPMMTCCRSSIWVLPRLAARPVSRTGTLSQADSGTTTTKRKGGTRHCGRDASFAS